MNDAVPTFNEIKSLAEDIEDLAAQGYAKESKLNRMSQGETLGSYLADPADALDYVTSVSHITPLFKQAAGANPSLFDSIIHSLAETAKLLGSVGIGGRINDTKSAVEEWDGEAAENFELHFLGKFEPMRANQLELIEVLIISIDANQVLLEKIRQDVFAIGEKAKTALEKIVASSEAYVSSQSLIALGTLATAAATLLTGGSLTLAMVVGGVVSVSSGAINAEIAEGSAISPERDPFSIGGDTVDAILASVDEALSVVHTTLIEGETAIKSGMDDALALISENRRTDYEAPRPSLAYADKTDLTDGVLGFGQPE